MADGKLQLELSREQALVFFDWLARFNQAEAVEFEDQAEQRVLWDIEAMLEATLVEPLDTSYDELVSRARAKLRDTAG